MIYYKLNQKREVVRESNFLIWFIWMKFSKEFRKLNENKIPSRNVAISMIFNGVEPLFTIGLYQYKDSKYGEQLLKNDFNSQEEAETFYNQLGEQTVAFPAIN